MRKTLSCLLVLCLLFGCTAAFAQTPDRDDPALYLGDWYCISMTEGDETMSPADYGMTVILTLKEDGTGVLGMMDDEETFTWEMIVGGISVMGLTGVYRDDDTLCIAEEGSEMLFTRDADSIRSSGADMSAFAEYIGVWSSDELGLTLTVCEDGTATLSAYGENVTLPLTESFGYLNFADVLLSLQYDGKLLIRDAELEAYLTRAGEEAEKKEEAEETIEEARPRGIDMTPYSAYIGLWSNGTVHLSVDENGLAVLRQGDESKTILLSEKYGFLTADGLYLMLQSDGALSISGAIYAVLTKESVPDPIPAPTPEPTPVPTPEPTPVPTPEPTPVPAPQMLSAEERLEKRFVCIGADMGDLWMDEQMLGGAYSMVFHANGRMDFVMADYEVPGGFAWKAATISDADEKEAPAFVIDYYGTDMAAIFTANGFDMNFRDLMLLHFVPEEAAQ